MVRDLASVYAILHTPNKIVQILPCMADFLKVTSDVAFKPTHSFFFLIRIKRFLPAIQSKASNTCTITFERVTLCAASGVGGRTASVVRVNKSECLALNEH